MSVTVAPLTGAPLTIAPLTGAALEAALPDLARLRIAVFRAFPYLYDGNDSYEQHYLRSYRATPGAVLVAAKHGDTIIGAATAMPLAHHADAAQIGAALDPATTFYLAESVLSPAYRGRGLGHAFFDHREQAARAQGFTQSAFCAVIRPSDHPQRPATYAPLDPFWRKRGYTPLPGATATFSWTDLGATAETPKPLQVWTKPL